MNDGRIIAPQRAEKSVLMICPGFFGYREAIAEQMRALGCHVDVYDERLRGGFVAKAMIRLNCKLYYPKIRRYYASIVQENAGKDYDVVFVVKGEAITQEVMELLRSAYPRAEFVLYLWDAVANVPDGENRIGRYDRALTFDPGDAQKYNMQFRPLFFGNEFASGAQGKGYAYDVAFVGTAHSIRPRVVHDVKEQCRRLNRKVYSYFYCPYRLVYWKGVLTNRNFRYLKQKDVHFTPLAKETINEIYSESRCVLDVEHTNQSGLTMRTIEMVGMGKKIITTNRQIKQYDFYDPNNILVIDRDEAKIDPDFFDREFRPIPESVRRGYSIEAFVRDILKLGVE